MVTPRTRTISGLGVAEARLCLDFINTEGEVRNSPPDRVESVDLFLDWALQNGLTNEENARGLRDSAAATADGTESFLAAARGLRESLYRIFSALAEDNPPPANDIAALDQELCTTLPQLRLVWRDDGFQWALPPKAKRLPEVLWPIALSAADLLRSELLLRVKECGSDTCSWMFIDESRNRSRRWCDMADCGNRAKARRFYRRHLKDQAAS